MNRTVQIVNKKLRVTCFDFTVVRLTCETAFLWCCGC